MVGEVTAVRESRRDCNLADRLAVLPQKRLSTIHATARDILMYGLPDRGSKRRAEMRNA